MNNLKPNAAKHVDVVEQARQKLSEEQVEKLKKRATPPRKFLDKYRTTITPEWLVWNDLHKMTDEDYAHHALSIHGDVNANTAVYFPEEFDKDLGDGSWVFVIDPPHTELSDRFQVPLLSMWYARPHVMNQGALGGRLPYQAVIQTPAGDLHLWPHEYTVCQDPGAFLGEEGTEIHALGGEPLLPEDQLWYLMSRGISRHDATMMLFNEIDSQSFCYVTFHKEIVAFFAGVGTRTSATVRRDYQEGRIT